MTYEEYRNGKQREVNALPLFFAFGKKQLAEEMEKRGLTLEDTDKICHVYAGGYCLKTDLPVIRAFFSREDQLPKLMEDFEFAEDAFFYEMCNHEFGINWQGAFDVCSCFGTCTYDEEKGSADYLQEMGYPEETLRAYRAARKRYYKTAAENDWY